MGRPAKDRAEAILRAARAEFRESGLARTTVDDIAARAGVGKGTVFLYWPSKTRLHDAVLLLDLAGYFADLAADLREGRTPLRLSAIVRRYIEISLANPDMAPLMLDVGAPTAEQREVLDRALRGILAVARAHGLITDAADDEIIVSVETLTRGALGAPVRRKILLDAVEHLVASAYETGARSDAAIPEVNEVLEAAVDQFVDAAAPDRPTTAVLRPRPRSA